MTKAEKFALLTDRGSAGHDLRGRSVRAALSSSTVAMVEFALRMGSTAVLARLISPEHFGLIMMVAAVTAIADQFRDLGLSLATVQRPSITHEEATNLFWINLGVGAMLALVISASSPLIAAYYAEPRLIPVTCVLAANFVFGGLMTQHQAMLTRQLQLGHTAVVRLGSTALSTALAIFLAWQGAGYWALVFREIARSALLAAGMWRCFRWIPSLPFRGTSVREIVRSGLHFSGANIFGACAGGADRFIFGRTLGAEPVAIFRQAYMLLLAPMDQVLNPLFGVSTPGMSQLQSDGRRYERYYLKLVSLVCLATMPASVFVAIYADEVTRILLGPKWSACAPIVAIFCLSVFIRQPIESTSMILVTRQQSKRYMVLSFVQNAAGVVALLIGVQWGLHGAAWADVALTYLLIAPKIWYAFRGSPVSVRNYFRTLARPAAASIGMGLLLLAAKHGLPTMPVIATVTTGALIAAVGFVGAWLLTPGGKAELAALRGDLLSALRRKSPAPAPAT